MAQSPHNSESHRSGHEVPRQTTKAGSQSTWEKIMGANNPPPVKYDKISVLILGWGKDDDDTDSHQELIPLKEVLEEMYGFPVQYSRMHVKVHPQAQATTHVGKFICDHDQSGGLLIVYYAGHGYADSNSVGRISLRGRYPDNPAEEDMSIEWIDVERTLAKTKSDVLVIFDCCHAGLLCQPAMRGSRRSFHYVAACKADQVTRRAGDSSFTTAMIWALKRLAKSSGFTVTRLVSTLMEYESFPRHEQEAVVYPSRWGLGEREIWLTPKRAQGVASPLPNGIPDTKQEDFVPTADVLDLRFHFADCATTAHIEETATALKDFMEANRTLHFHRISFIDHTSFLESTAKRWLEIVRRKSAAKEDATLVVQRTTLTTSAAVAENFKSRLLKLPEIETNRDIAGSTVSTTAVATPASASCSWEKETFAAKSDNEIDGMLYHLIMALVLLFIQELQTVLVWHSAVAWTALLATATSWIWC